MPLLAALLLAAAPVHAGPSALSQLGAQAGLEAPLAPLPPRRASGLELTPEQAEKIGRLIWRNEGEGKVSALTHWNEGEDFASMGIGHFIWAPAGTKPPFTEDFPPLVRYLEQSGAAVPSWLRGGPACPWADRAAFVADLNGPRLTELRSFLASTFSLQARFIARRSQEALPRVLAAASQAERASLEARHAAVASTANGVYALVDYVNFKGEGVNPAESYAGQGWGLLQVLQEMGDAPAGQEAARRFSAAAERVLSRRVSNAPPARRESRWLPGWKARVRTYKDPL